LNPRRNSSIRRLLTVFGILASVILVVALLSALLLEWQVIDSSHRRELASAHQLAQVLIQGRLASARLLAEQAAHQAEPAASAPGQVTLLVMASDGKLLASSSGRSLPRLSALAGHIPSAPFDGVEIDDQGALVAVGAAAAGQHLVVAALPLTTQDAQGIKDATDLEISLFAGKKRVATTLRDRNGQPATTVPLATTDPATLALTATRLLRVQEPALPEHSYLEIQVPLHGVDGSPVGAYTVSRPSSGPWAWLLQRLWGWAAVALAGSILLLLLTTWLGRSIERPLQALQRDLSSLADNPGAKQLTAMYRLAELNALLPYVNQMSSTRAALARTNERLSDRLMRIQTLAVLGQLAAGVAHDLNNPLTTIMGLADIILAADPDTDTRRDVSIIRRQAERSGSIVRSLLSFARRQRDEPQWASLNELISQTIELLAYQIRIGNVRCETHLADDLPPIWCDASQMQQVLFNLIINALQAMTTTHGRGNLRVESSWSPPGPDAPQGHVTIRVRDDGPGIPEEALLRLFEPYFTTKGAEGGTGLGLSIASAIVKRHGGRIWAENNPRGGACFTAQLPVAPQQFRGAVDAAAGAPEAGPRRILLADSDAQRVGLLARILRRQGYLVSIANDGLLARSKLEMEPSDLVVCALRMSRLDGRELYAWARVHRPELAGRFVFIVADEFTSEVESFLQIARAWALVPPFQEHSVRAIVSQALR
jgi:signal transduction histidine kinase